MINRLAIFGATGDLTARYLLPGLAALHATGRLGDGLQVTGASREGWDSGEFQRWAADQLGRQAGQIPASARQAVVSASRYCQADVADPAGVAAVIAGDGPVAAYLALPPAVFPIAVSALHEAGLPDGSRIVLEKPFGEDLTTAVELNRLLAGLVPEQAVFRVDHFLAMTTVHNVLNTRSQVTSICSPWPRCVGCWQAMRPAVSRDEGRPGRPRMAGRPGTAPCRPSYNSIMCAKIARQPGVRQRPMRSGRPAGRD